MVKIIDLTPDGVRSMEDSPEVIRVGVMAPVNSRDEITLCERWADPFVKNNMEVIRIPVEQRPVKGQDYKTPISDVLKYVDGLLMPGGDSHIYPPLYNGGGAVLKKGFDVNRDHYAVELLHRAYSMDLPTLGICRGMQEMIVAFDGQLQHLDDSVIDHGKGYEYKGDHKKMDEPVHEIVLHENGLLAAAFGSKRRFSVNSIHEEGVTRDLWECNDMSSLREGFRIEAISPKDQVIEGVSAKGKSFFLGVQAHFELCGDLHDKVFGTFFDHIKIRNSSRIKEYQKDAAMMATAEVSEMEQIV